VRLTFDNKTKNEECKIQSYNNGTNLVEYEYDTENGDTFMFKFNAFFGYLMCVFTSIKYQLMLYEKTYHCYNDNSLYVRKCKLELFVRNPQPCFQRH